MATTVHSPATQPTRDASRPTDSSGNGGWRNVVPEGGELRAMQEYAPPPASTGVWVFVAGVSMTFAALTSALVVPQGRGIGVATLHAAIHSLSEYGSVTRQRPATLEISRRHVAAFMGGVKATTANQRAGSTPLFLSDCFPCRPVPRLAAIKRARPLSREQSQQFILLRIHRRTRPAPDGRLVRNHSRDP